MSAKRAAPFLGPQFKRGDWRDSQEQRSKAPSGLPQRIACMCGAAERAVKVGSKTGKEEGRTHEVGGLFSCCWKLHLLSQSCYVTSKIPAGAKAAVSESLKSRLTLTPGYCAGSHAAADFCTLAACHWLAGKAAGATTWQPARERSSGMLG